MAPITFTDTHNMIAFLTKSDASKGFDQIVDFLNAHSIQYALTVNPPIYVSCIKQFWASVSVKKTNDAVKLLALIDRKKVVVTEDTIRQDLRLDDADGVECLPNEEIFVELALDDLSSHTTKYTSPVLIQFFANMRRISKCFSGVETPLFDTMLVQPQADAEDDDNEVSAAPTPPLPTPATKPPSHIHEPLPPTQEPISSPPQAPPTSPSSPPP
nr:hypothetical protein [Tanacetum cinerariifolium]